MVKYFLSFTICFALVAIAPMEAVAQAKTAAPQGAALGPRRQLATIIFAGLAGGVLGLSTLSFYGRPQDKLSNIPLGAAIGIITGVTYTTFKAATQPKDFYSRSEGPELWQLAEQKSASSRNPQFTFALDF